MKTLCVYCGSSMGNLPIYREAAHRLGTLMAEHGYTLVYGGGNVGLMGTVADAVMARGGKVIGVIPQALVDKELAHHNITTLHTVQTMHERKMKMVELADGFIALPGGVGTMDELFEIITWSQLRFHSKPIGLLNIEGYYDKLLDFLHHMLDNGFIKPAHLETIIVDHDPATLLQKF